MERRIRRWIMPRRFGHLPRQPQQSDGEHVTQANQANQVKSQRHDTSYPWNRSVLRRLLNPLRAGNRNLSSSMTRKKAAQLQRGSTAQCRILRFRRRVVFSCASNPNAPADPTLCPPFCFRKVWPPSLFSLSLFPPLSNFFFATKQRGGDHDEQRKVTSLPSSSCFPLPSSSLSFLSWKRVEKWNISFSLLWLVQNKREQGDRME